MWRDERGLIHTVNIPWGDAVGMSTKSYGILKQAPAASLYDLLEDTEDDIFRRIEGSPLSAVQEARYAERPPPRIKVGILGPQHVTAEILGLQLSRQPMRWRLDYVWALRDCLDALPWEWAESAEARLDLSRWRFV